jgi:hypothetical protein
MAGLYVGDKGGGAVSSWRDWSARADELAEWVDRLLVVLRDERRRGRIAASQVVGRRIRYKREDRTAYLAERRCGR